MKTVSLETRNRMSESAKRRCTSEWRAAKSKASSTPLPLAVVERMYREGATQVEVGRFLRVSQKVVWRFMKNNGIPARLAAKRDQRGANNSSWKGVDATYSTFHVRVEAARGKPAVCEKCPTTEGRFEWANLNGNYEDIDDYARLCVSCHRKLDAARRKATGTNTSKHVPRTRREV